MSRRTPHPLGVLAAAFTLLVLLHNAFTPIFEAPDEVWHYAYVRWLAEGHSLPPLTDNRSGAYQEAAQPPLYYAVAALIGRPFPDDNLAAVRRANPGFGTQAPGTSPDNKNMILHPAGEDWPWRGAVLAVHATRLASWLFGLLTVIAAWGLGYEAFGTRRGALLTAAFVAFHPQFVFLSSVVNNDTAAAAMATTALWLGARGLRRGVTPRLAVAAGVIVGLGVLAKTSVLPLVPLWAAVVVGAALTSAPHNRRPSWGPAILRPLGLYLAATGVMGSWWYARNTLLYGDPLGLTAHLQTLWGRTRLATWRELLPEIPLLLRSFWGAYGWGHVTWPDATYGLLWAAALALLIPGALSAIRGLWRAAGELGRRTQSRIALPPPVATGALALVWFLGLLVALLRWMRQVQAPHGRLLFPAIGAWALLLALGAAAWQRRWPRWGRRLTGGILGLSAVLAILAPGARLLATFAPPRLRAPAAVTATCAQPLDLRYGAQARLLCADLTSGTAAPQNPGGLRLAPGEQVQVRTCWEALAPMANDYTVFVHLLGPEEIRPGERHTYPGLGRFPTSFWPVGRAFCDTITVAVEDWAPAPIRYRVAVGLYDAETGARLPVQRGDGQPAEPPLVGAVAVVPPSGAQPEPGEAVGATFHPADDGEAAIELQSIDAPTAADPGSTVEITLHWAARQDIAADYVAFVHLWTPGTTEPLAQHDGPPRGGWFPTSAWRAGDHVPDTHEMDLPASLPPGTYPLWAGLYRAVDGTRLPAYGPEGRYTNDLVPVGSLTIP